MGVLFNGEKLKQNSIRYFDQIARENFEIEETTLCYGDVSVCLSRLPSGKLADIGCGTGRMLRYLEEEFPGKFELYGIDISPESIRVAGENNPGLADFREGDAEHLPYEAESFAVFLCMHSFHHYPDPDAALREMSRCLKPGGTLILVENEYRTLRRIWLNTCYRLGKYKLGDVRMYSEKELRALIEKAGFTVEKKSEIAMHSQLLECRKS